MSKPIIQNYGGGVQTIAIGVLIRQGLLPRPERVVIANTGREVRSTFAYLENHARQLYWDAGCEIEIISHDNAKHDLYYTNGQGIQNALPAMPVFTRQSGKLGQTQNFCSGFWKRDVVIDWLKQPENGYGKTNPVIQCIGFSTNEISRCKPSTVKWREHHYPLCYDYGIRLNRQECVDLITSFGLPVPKKSRCWCCSFQSNKEWREIKDNPVEWTAAIELDYELRSNDPSNSVFLHRDGVPLIDADLSDTKRALFDYDEMECAEGCWT